MGDKKFKDELKKIKKDFEKAVEKPDKKLYKKHKKSLEQVIKKGSAFESKVKTLDEWLKKRHRGDSVKTHLAIQALKVSYFGEIKGLKIVDTFHPAIEDFKEKLTNLVDNEMAASIKALQESRGRGKAEVIEVKPFLADIKYKLKEIKGTLKKNKTAEAAEKKHKLEKKMDPIRKCLEKYTKAAARGKRQDAIDALGGFEGLASTFVGECKTIKSSVSDTTYLSAVDALLEQVKETGKEVKKELKLLESAASGGGGGGDEGAG